MSARDIIESFTESDVIIGYEYKENGSVRIYYHPVDSEDVIFKDFMYIGNITPILNRLMRNAYRGGGRMGGGPQR
jgi:hypothetical protein